VLAHTAKTMGQRGLLNPGRPDRVLRQLWALKTWGYGLGGELRSATVRSPDQLAVVDEHRSLTYRQLLDAVCIRAAQLQESAPTSRIGLLRRNNADFVIDVIACAVAGLDVVLMNTQHAAAALASIRDSQRIDQWLCDEEFVPLIRPTRLPAIAPGTELRPPSREGRTIVLTSGTTGWPKGARRPTSSGMGPLISILSRIPIQACDRTLIAAPMFHTWGYAGLQLSLAMRATMVLRSRFDAADILDTVERERCDVLFAVPVMLARLLDEQPRRTRLRVAAVSGSALPGDLATRFMDAYGDILYNLYGSTEASWVSIATPDDLRANPTTAGRPPRGTVVKIIDGAIHVHNDMLFEGYTNDAGARLVDGLLATGDRGHWGPDGLLFVDGRTDDMIISGGENIYPSTIEQAIATIPEVAEVAVFGVPDKQYGERPAAWVVVRPGVTVSADAIRDTVRRLAAGFCVPRDVHFLPELPRNAAGKVVRRQLPEF
jgi:acyl-CoA synthetase (AMP-forming)/AMP-acid ligase II